MIIIQIKTVIVAHSLQALIGLDADKKYSILSTLPEELQVTTNHCLLSICYLLFFSCFGKISIREIGKSTYVFLFFLIID